MSNEENTNTNINTQQDQLLELMIRQNQLLESIDWKLWELYKSLVKDEEPTK